jgi:hypothetical protein
MCLKGWWMNKKRYIVALLFHFVPISLFSAWSFVYEGWLGHPQIISGLVPTGISVGARSSMPSLFAGWETDFSLMGKTGYHQRMLWQDPSDGSYPVATPLVYDTLLFDWKLVLRQFLGTEKHASLSLGYAGSFERALDPLAEGRTLESGLVTSPDTWFSTYGGDNFYGALSGIGTILFAVFSYDRYIDTRVMTDGYQTSLLLKFGPRLLNTNASYLSAEASAQWARTLYTNPEGKDRNLYSIVLADRILASAVYGSAIPPSLSQTTSLGSMVRGFEPWMYPIDLALANQAEIRFNGPESFAKGCFPRLVLFYDNGFGLGNVYGTNQSLSSVLASVGVAFSYSLSYYMDIGYQMAYLIAGSNPASPAKVIIGQLSAHFRF